MAVTPRSGRCWPIFGGAGQESMQMGKGSGQNEGGFQLPDIIKGQQQLGEKMGQQGQSGKEGKSGLSRSLRAAVAPN